MIGELLIDRYLILKELGSGGFSKTYLARDQYRPGHPVCIVKQLVLAADSTLTPEESRHLFQQEAGILQTLGEQKQDRLPTLLAAVMEAESVYLVEEYIEGENLAIELSQLQRFKPKAIVTLLHDVLPLLTFIHQHHIVHQDIKPSNLVRRQSDRKVALIDFGAALTLTPGSKFQQSATQPKQFGTTGYFAPEQRAGEVTFSSDLYALGITAIQLLTGIHPQQMQRHPLSGELVWHCYLRGQPVNARLVAILNKLVKRKPDDRYNNAAEVLADLQGNQQQIRLLKRRSLVRWGLSAIALGTAVTLWSNRSNLPFNRLTPTLAALSEQLPFASMSAEASLKLFHQEALNQSIDYLLTAPQALIILQGQTLHVRSLETGTEIKSWLLPQLPQTVAIDGEGNRIAISADRSVWVGELSSGRPLQSLELDTAPDAIALDSTGRLLVIQTEQAMQVWEVDSAKQVQTINSSDATAMLLTSNPADRLICALEDYRLKLWTPQTGQLQEVFAGHTQRIETLQIDPANGTLYSFGGDRAIAWNIETRELIRAFPPESAQTIRAALIDGQLLTLHRDGAVRLWDIQSGHLLRKVIQLSGRSDLSPDGRYLINLSNRELRIWQFRKEQDHAP